MEWWNGWYTLLCVTWVIVAVLAWAFIFSATRGDEMPCGHSKDSIRGNGTTWYCGECENE